MNRVPLEIGVDLNETHPTGLTFGHCHLDAVALQGKCVVLAELMNQEEVKRSDDTIDASVKRQNTDKLRHSKHSQQNRYLTTVSVRDKIKKKYFQQRCLSLSEPMSLHDSLCIHHAHFSGVT